MMASVKKFTFLLVAVAVLLAIVIGILIASAFSFWNEFRQPTEYLVSGNTVHIGRSGTHNIYVEDSAPPRRFVHDFTFTNIETGAVVYSFPPTSNFSYSVGSVIINGEIRSGRFGERVAMVRLEAGAYTIEFAPHASSGDFVLGNMFNRMVRFFVQMLLLVLALCALSVALIAVFITRRNRIIRTSSAHASIGIYPRN